MTDTALTGAGGEQGDEQLKLFDVGVTRAPAPEVEEFELDPVEIDHTQPFPFAPLSGADLDEKRIYRYMLWRRFRDQGPTCLMIGQNPSTADENDDDPTVRREIDFAKSFEQYKSFDVTDHLEDAPDGADGWERIDMQWVKRPYAVYVKANLFAYRATDPKDLRRAAKAGVDVVGPLNNDYLKRLHQQADITICAWGNGGAFKRRDMQVIEMLGNIKPLYCLRMTKRGKPWHTLYLPKTCRPIPFRGVEIEEFTG